MILPELCRKRHWELSRKYANVEWHNTKNMISMLNFEDMMVEFSPDSHLNINLQEVHSQYEEYNLNYAYSSVASVIVTVVWQKTH